MASPSSTLSTTLSTTTPSTVTKPISNLPPFRHSSSLPFRFSSKPTKLRFFAKGLQPSWKYSTVVKAQLNEVALEGSSNAAASPPAKSKVPAGEAKDAKASNEPSPTLATEESISEFITQVASLIKLVDSRDIVELQLKQFDCEITIRKKAALPQPLPPPMTMMSPPSPPPAMPIAPPTPSPTPAATAPSPAPSSSPAPTGKSAKSSHHSLKCPMSGTFYRSPAPGEPPFVKVGDKVQKGQVLCIIEAMKLMNEIEADQSGTIVEIVAEDGKSVSVDTPLFMIEP